MPGGVIAVSAGFIWYGCERQTVNVGWIVRICGRYNMQGWLSTLPAAPAKMLRFVVP